MAKRKNFATDTNAYNDNEKLIANGKYKNERNGNILFETVEEGIERGKKEFAKFEAEKFVKKVKVEEPVRYSGMYSMITKTYDRDLYQKNLQIIKEENERRGKELK